ncbi:MAG: tetratricopeptide repeat protein [Cyanobacteria bacterium SIG28]|nr:tetratricopeptide repeat protein [Cyanobacteria bacterium SIG28]
MNDYKYYLDQAIFDIQDGHYQLAIEKLDESLNIKNDWEIPYFYRAVANQALENFDDAILDYTKALQLNEKMTDAYYNRAKILLSRKDIENPDFNRAIADLEKALELDPNFVEALYAMGAAQKKVENYHKALEYLNRAVELNPDFIHAKALQKLILTKYLNKL